MTQKLYLKFGSVKGYKNLSDTSVDALQKWADLGVALSVTATPRTDEHKAALCAAIDVISSEGGEIWNDWKNTIMSCDEAKKYVNEYGD